jgi:hypothetical protein
MGKPSKLSKKILEQAIECGIESLGDWVHRKGYEVDFDYSVHDEFRPADSLITISTRCGREKQLYAFLHECGHLILNNNEKLYEKKYPSSAKMAHFQSNKKLERSHKYKIDVISEEIDAWRKGRELAKRLDIYVDEEKYYSLMTECVYTYVKHLARS